MESLGVILYNDHHPAPFLKSIEELGGDVLARWAVERYEPVRREIEEQLEWEDDEQEKRLRTWCAVDGNFTAARVLRTRDGRDVVDEVLTGEHGDVARPGLVIRIDGKVERYETLTIGRAGIPFIQLPEKQVVLCYANSKHCELPIAQHILAGAWGGGDDDDSPLWQGFKPDDLTQQYGHLRCQRIVVVSPQCDDDASTQSELNGVPLSIVGTPAELLKTIEPRRGHDFWRPLGAMWLGRQRREK